MIISHTPLRISFAGGGTDFAGFYRVHGGAVLSMAIDKGIKVIVQERQDRDISVTTNTKQVVPRIEEITNEFVREALRKTGVDSSVDIIITSDITSEGSGLGSSSCLTVGLLNALHGYRGKRPDPEYLAREACEIEIDILGKPIGKQDQYIAAFGGVHHFEFAKNEDVNVTPIDLDPHHIRQLESSLMLFSTGITRKSAGVLQEQKERIGEKTDVLTRLRDLAFELQSELRSGNIDHVGVVLDKGWELKKRLASGIANREIDEMYERAKVAGALGGKIAGAGGGGFLLLYVPLGKKSSVSRALETYRELKVARNPHGSRIVTEFS